MTTAAMPVLSRTTQAATILERSVCLTLECHYLGNNRKIDLDDLLEAASGRDATSRIDEEQVYATKRLIDSKELRPVMRVFGVAKAQLRAKAIASHQVFGERSYLIPLALVEQVDADLEACEKELRKQSRELAYRRYAQAVERQRTALGPTLFREGDYLTPEQVVSKFAIDWSYVSFAAPDRLETVSSVLARKAHQKHEARLAQAYDEVVRTMWADALSVVSRLEEWLRPDDDGKPKMLRGHALKHLQEYLQFLPAKNLTGDVELPKALATLQRLATGLDVQTLRDSDATRAAMHHAADAAKAVLQDAIETGRRAISFGPIGA